MSWLGKRRGQVAAKTIQRERVTLLTIWRFAYEEDLVDEFPKRIPKITLTRKIPKAWKLEEFEQILIAISKLRGEMRETGILRSVWWTSLVLSLYWTGARIGALLQVRTEDVSLDDRQLILRADSAKTGEPQMLCLHQQAAEAIAKHYDLTRELVWPYPFHRRQIYEQLKAILKTAGLPNDRYRMFHAFRKTCFSLAYAHGSAEIARAQRGHRTDMSRHYLDPRVANQRQAADVLPVPTLAQ